MTATTTTSPPACQIVFVTDRGLLRPTLVAIWSLLRHLSCPADLHLWGDGLGDADWQAVHRVAETGGKASLQSRAIDPTELAGAGSPAAHISAAAMGRLFIPRHLSGRVLYIDGDTLITGDVAPLFDLPLLPGERIGAARDYVTAEWLAGGRLNDRRRQRLAALEKHMDPRGYFNSGVLLMDCDAIRAEPDLQARLEDVAAATATDWGDQDHLNFLFSGRTHLLNPAWNSSWQRSPAQRRFAKKLGGEVEETRDLPDAIIHYHGPKKPWKAPRYDLWSARARAVLRYRRELGSFITAFPDLAP
ncbi:glycosyltransferase family 8 protein [Paracoccus zhejiangensis]|uniref:Lipopolysaccharide 3-alpha-galactosyltransferase n=1 Tax=Paracoccus zhejiangensis TaxID=1077935 RepID=A0A2H5EZB6_9RHOB|nr:glycosyltransferase family 8 protein [Paracoccus zhejiangensis]AUH64646.1 lipopolysaccharide 3-alpha-galactosyltransferase [Paracoccus zhejiangensis]